MHVFDGKKLNFHFLFSLFSGIAARRLFICKYLQRQISVWEIVFQHTHLLLWLHFRVFFLQNDSTFQVVKFMETNVTNAASLWKKKMCLRCPRTPGRTTSLLSWQLLSGFGNKFLTAICNIRKEAPKILASAFFIFKCLAEGTFSLQTVILTWNKLEAWK